MPGHRTQGHEDMGLGTLEHGTRGLEDVRMRVHLGTRGRGTHGLEEVINKQHLNCSVVKRKVKLHAGEFISRPVDDDCWHP